MKVTKYEHACFTVEHDGKLLIVDPGGYTTSLDSPENVVAIVVTHEHGDHFDPTALGAIIAHNPDAIILGPEHVTAQFGNTLPSRAVKAGEKVDIEPFELEFFGGTHAEIHPSIPLIDNIGVLINDAVYYPGDSFAQPGRPVELLALPTSAPWLKISEVIDFMIRVQPAQAFPTHNALYSSIGETLVDRIIKTFAKDHHIVYTPLAPDESLEL